MSATLSATAEVGAAAPSLPRLLYKISEAAQVLGISEMSVRRLISAGHLKVSRRFRHLLIPAGELSRFAARVA
jgi:excisionase family DNA binding protein